MIRLKTKQLAMIVKQPYETIMPKQEFFLAITAYLYNHQIISEEGIITLDDDLQNLFQTKGIMTIADFLLSLRAHFV